MYNRYIMDTTENETVSSVQMWMELESVTQSEVSQKHKNKYPTLTHVCGI